LRVARARRQVHQQEIHLAPFHGEQKLLDRFEIIGPRQITGWSFSSNNPMLITFTP